MDYKKLSIIIPVYNTEVFLRKCLESVIKAVNGIEDDVEVLLINDGSTDGSRKILEEYCQRYHSWMRCYDKKNGGLSDVKNYGLERAKGEYVIFLDSDDYIEPDMYKQMLKTAEEEEADVVICNIKLAYDDTSKDVVQSCVVESRSGIFNQVIDFPMMATSCNKIVKKELYEGLTFPVRMNNEDVAVTPIVLAKAKNISVIKKPYYNYYQRTGSIQNSKFDEKRFVILETSKLCVERLKGLDSDKVESVKGSVYLHQVLGIAFYPIRTENFVNRYKLLKKYMKQVQKLFPDIWDNFEVKEFLTWEGRYMQVYRRVSVFLLKQKLYLLTSIFWGVCNGINTMLEKKTSRKGR